METDALATARIADARDAVPIRPLLAVPLALGAIHVLVGGGDLLLAAVLEVRQPGVAATTFGAIAGAASLLALVAYPVAGWLSDRVPARVGGRSLVAVAGGAVVVGAVTGLGSATALAAIALAYVLALGLAPLILVPGFAAIPDRVERGERGLVSGVAGAAVIGGGIGGNLLASPFAREPSAGALAFAALVAAGAVGSAALLGPRTAPSRGAEPGGGAEPADGAGRDGPGGAATVTGPGGRRHTAERDDDRPAREDPAATPPGRGSRSADFAWVLVGRLTLLLAYTSFVGLVFYVYRDHLRLADPAASVAGFAVVSGGATLVASLLTGRWSDRARRRRPFVAGGAFGIAAGLGVAIALPTPGGLLAAGAVVGLGFGAYLATGTALATLVLPSPRTTGRDVGLVGLSGAIGQAIAPAAGAWIAAVAGYPALFAVGAAAALASAGTVAAIRTER